MGSDGRGTRIQVLCMITRGYIWQPAHITLAIGGSTNNIGGYILLLRLSTPEIHLRKCACTMWIYYMKERRMGWMETMTNEW